jgi:cellulose synthase/poly-beta-1,6-N-acetylglucosamine synthase-like glycosyltransferase
MFLLKTTTSFNLTGGTLTTIVITELSYYRFSYLTEIRIQSVHILQCYIGIYWSYVCGINISKYKQDDKKLNHKLVDNIK